MPNAIGGVPKIPNGNNLNPSAKLGINQIQGKTGIQAQGLVDAKNVPKINQGLDPAQISGAKNGGLDLNASKMGNQ